MNRKDQVVQTLISGVEYLLKKNKITFFQGEAKITEDLVVSIGNDKIKGKGYFIGNRKQAFYSFRLKGWIKWIT